MGQGYARPSEAPTNNGVAIGGVGANVKRLREEVYALSDLIEKLAARLQPVLVEGLQITLDAAEFGVIKEQSPYKTPPKPPTSLHAGELESLSGVVSNLRQRMELLNQQLDI